MLTRAIRQRPLNAVAARTSENPLIIQIETLNLLLASPRRWRQRSTGQDDDPENREGQQKNRPGARCGGTHGEAGPKSPEIQDRRGSLIISAPTRGADPRERSASRIRPDSHSARSHTM